jgi:hypothetical protein
MSERDGRFVKVDLTEDECDAVHVLCDMAGAMLRDLGHSVPKSQADNLRARLNTVRYKMGASLALFGNPRGSAIAPGLILDIHGRNKPNG